jgi:hypothetical protein
VAATSYEVERGRSARLIEGRSKLCAGLHVWPVDITRSCDSEMQLTARLSLAAILGQEVEMALVSLAARALLNKLPGETVRKGYEQRSDHEFGWYTEVKNGAKSPSLAPTA